MGPKAEERNDRTARLAFRVYKAVLSPILHTISPSRCLYLPTCSEYAYTAVSRFGWLRGSWLALGRFNQVFDIDGACRVPAVHGGPAARG